MPHTPAKPAQREPVLHHKHSHLSWLFHYQGAQCRWAGALAPVLRALLTAVRGGCITLCRCDVAAAEETAVATGGADALLHAGCVLQVPQSFLTGKGLPQPSPASFPSCDRHFNDR